MTISFDDIVEACQIVAQQEQINVCITESLKGASVAGVGAFALGVLFGPVGIAIGGALGGYAGSTICKKYVPLYKVISEMSKEDKVKLVAHMTKVIQGLDISDAIMLTALVTNHDAGRQIFLRGLTAFAQQISK